MAKSPAWKDILKQKGWDDAYMAGPAFEKFLKDEQRRVGNVLKILALVKPMRPAWPGSGPAMFHLHHCCHTDTNIRRP